MKVALLLSGHFRDASSCYPYIKKEILDKLDCDVFISSWNPGGDFSNYIPVPTRSIKDSFSLQDVISFYKPKSLLTEDFDSPKIQKLIQKAWDLDCYGPMNGETNPVSILCMWYKIQSCLSLMKDYEKSVGFEYDFVIKGRFDIKILNQINLEERPSHVKIPKGFDWRGGYNDIMAWGARDEMIYYCNLFGKIEEYLLNDGVFFHPETLLKYHLINSPFGVYRPDTLVTLREKNIWEHEYVPDNHKILQDI